jgi:hypothetical protein
MKGNNDMKKIILFLLIFLCFNLNFFIPIAYAQDPGKELNKVLNSFTGTSIPGLDCGVGGATDGTEKCCNTNITQMQKLPTIPTGLVTDILSNFPLLGGLLSGYKDLANDVDQRFKTLQEFQKNNPGTVCIYGDPKPNASDPNCMCEATSAAMNRPIAELCYKSLGKSKDLASCMGCAASNGVWTGIGCIPLNLQSFVSGFLLSIGIGLGGVIALLCIIYSAFSMQTSQGNPEKIKKAQELLTSCIMGLMLIIFSVFILRVIGVSILKIPFIQ